MPFAEPNIMPKGTHGGVLGDHGFQGNGPRATYVFSPERSL